MSVTEKTTFGIPSLPRRTPSTIKWLVVIIALLTGCADVWVSGTQLLSNEAKVEILLGSAVLYKGITFLAPFFGKLKK